MDFQSTAPDSKFPFRRPELTMKKINTSLTIMAILFVIKFTFAGLSDPDFFWHLKTGEYIVSMLVIPVSDPFSFTFLGKQWIPHEWLTEVILYAANNSFGFYGIKILVATICIATFHVQLNLAKNFLSNETWSILLCLAFFAPNLIFFTPRPQIFTFLLFSIFLHALLQYKYSRSVKLLYWLPFLMVLWVNLHGAFIIGIVLLGLFTASEWCNMLIRPKAARSTNQALTTLSFVSGATVLAAAINPQHLHIFVYPFQVLNLDVAIGMIAEWRSPNFHILHDKIYLALIIGFFFLLIYSKKKPDVTEIIIPTFFIVSALTAIRHMPLMSVVLLAFSAVFLKEVAIANKAKYMSHGTSVLFKNASREISPTRTAIANVFLIVVFSGTLLLQDSESKVAGQNEKALPVGAANFVISNKLDGNMFNSYDIGGYLIYRLAPDRKVFIDGRADVYGDKFINDYITIYSGKAGWKEKFDKFAIDYIVCENDAPIRQILNGNGSFKQVFVDEKYSVLVRNDPKHAPLVKKFSTASMVASN